MASPSKQKGNRFERECVKIAKQYNFEESVRAYASNGLALGFTEDVDLKIVFKSIPLKIQCKCRKKLGEVVRPNNNVDMQLIKEDRGKIFAVIEYERLLELLCK